MKLRINGETREVPGPLATVADLIAWLDLPAFGSAVELNGEVIRRADHPRHTPEGDGLSGGGAVGGRGLSPILGLSPGFPASRGPTDGSLHPPIGWNG